MAKVDLKSKTKDELEAMLEKFSKERMNLRFQKSMGQLEKVSRVKVVRRDIARIKTLLNIMKDKVDA
ncbi:50S ribosomal protein L29 [Alphaproteobacteria bacterium]|nr:50S ribosomal protein L29 [Alphaproteobacteria bacterium]